MPDELKQVVEDGLTKVRAELDAAMKKYEGQVADNGKADEEIRKEVRALSEKLEASMTEIGQKLATANDGDPEVKSVGQQVVESDGFKALQTRDRERVRIEIKNTVLSDTTTVFPDQKPGVIPGAFKPLTIRQVLRSVPVTGNAVNALREATNTNNAEEVSQAETKPESAITFEQYNVVIETVAHFIKVSNQLLADAPAIAAYINGRLRDGLAQRIDRQLLLGNGTTPYLSGLTESGNFVAYTPTSDDLLVDAINRAKYTLWANGYTPDVAIVNPADWGAMERVREGSGSGTYLYGLPGMNAGMNPFGVKIVLSSHMTAGKILVGALDRAAVVYDRQGTTVEMGFVDDDFTRNLVTIRAEERLGLGVEVPSAILYGDFSA
jgi:HK97 family phage major capsid protein